MNKPISSAGYRSPASETCVSAKRDLFSPARAIKIIRMAFQTPTLLLARKNELVDQWLREHPFAEGSIGIVIGILLLIHGFYALLTGRTTSRGKEHVGCMAIVMGFIEVAGGTAFFLTGVCRIVPLLS